MNNLETERNPLVEPVPEPELEQKYETEEYKPSNNQVLRDYEIRIRFLNRGCIVSVGCKEIAFEDHTRAMLAINKYVNSPWEEQQRWRKILD